MPTPADQPAPIPAPGTPAAQPALLPSDDHIPATLADYDRISDPAWREARLEMARAAIADPMAEMRGRLERSRHISIAHLTDARLGVELAEVELRAAVARLAAVDTAIERASQAAALDGDIFAADCRANRDRLVAAFQEWQREATRTGVSPVVGIEAADPQAVAEACADFLLELLRGEG